MLLFTEPLNYSWIQKIRIQLWNCAKISIKYFQFPLQKRCSPRSNQFKFTSFHSHINTCTEIKYSISCLVFGKVGSQFERKSGVRYFCRGHFKCKSKSYGKPHHSLNIAYLMTHFSGFHQIPMAIGICFLEKVFLCNPQSYVIKLRIIWSRIHFEDLEKTAFLAIYNCKIELRIISFRIHVEVLGISHNEFCKCHAALTNQPVQRINLYH